MKIVRFTIGCLLRIYGIIRTRKLTTMTYGFFTILNKSNVKIGKRCSFNKGVMIQGNHDIMIEDDVVLSQYCMILDSGLDLSNFVVKGKRKHTKSFAWIKRGAWIGAGAIILPGVTVGEYSVVGAGSVVTKDVEPYSLVVGNPARFIRTIKSGKEQ